MRHRKARDFLLLNRLPDLDALADGLRDFCLRRGMTDEDFCDVRLAVEEAVSNTIRHGYAQGGLHPIRLRAVIKRGKLRLTIEDDARAFDPLAAPLPDTSLPVEEKRPGGLGILLLRSMVDRAEYRRRGGKNVLRLVRSLRPVSR